MRYILALVLSVCALAQSSRYPTAVDNDASLAVAVNNFSGRLSGGVSTTDTAWVLSGMTGTPVVNMLLTVDGEISQVTAVSGNAVTVTRGVDGTTAASHRPQSLVQGLITKFHHNVLADAVKKIETALGPNLANLHVSLPGLSAGSYNFSPQFPGGGLAPGNNVVTLSPVPLGVNGSNTGHYLYVSGGAGSPEPCLITGGTATAGATTGSIFLNCTNSHSGSFSVASATGGIQEAIWAAPSTGAGILVPSGVFDIRGPVITRVSVYTPIAGQGPRATKLRVHTDFPLTVRGVFDISGPGAWTYFQDGGVSGLSIVLEQPDEATLANYIHYPPAIYTSGTWHPTFADLEIVAAWDGIKADGATNAQGGLTISRVQMSAFHHGISIDASFQPTIIDSTTVDPQGLTSNQNAAMLEKSNGSVALYLGKIDALNVSNFTTDAAVCVDMHIGADGSMGPEGFFTNLWCDLGNFKLSEGNIAVTNSHLGTGSTVSAIVMTGGMLKIQNSHLATQFAAPLIDAAVTRGYNADQYAPVLEVSNSTFSTFIADIESVKCRNAGFTVGLGAFNCTLTGNYFERSIYSASAYTVPTVSFGAGVRGAVTGNTASPIGWGGQFGSFATDDYHVFSGNNIGAWTMVYPATMQKMRADDIVQRPVTTAVASTGTVTPTGPVFHVTGTALISAIATLPYFPYSQFTMIPDGAFTWVASPYIATSGTAVVGRPIVWTLDGTKWYPSY